MIELKFYFGVGNNDSVCLVYYINEDELLDLILQRTNLYEKFKELKSKMLKLEFKRI
jgi:hypothetical protein